LTVRDALATLPGRQIPAEVGTIAIGAGGDATHRETAGRDAGDDAPEEGAPIGLPDECACERVEAIAVHPAFLSIGSMERLMQSPCFAW
jgi:hypothetical protein